MYPIFSIPCDHTADYAVKYHTFVTACSFWFLDSQNMLLHHTILTFEGGIKLIDLAEIVFFHVEEAAIIQV
jgi:hypothetical protein